MANQKHWTEADFLDHLYGTGDADRSHLESCPDCRGRWRQWQAARASYLEQAASAEARIPVELLVAQREAIFSRAGQRPSFVSRFARWSPALGVAAMALLVVFWNQPSPQPVVSETAVTVALSNADGSDAQLMADIYSVAYEMEPVAIAPVRGLFEERQ